MPQVDAADHKIEKESALVVLPGRERIPLPCPELPELVINAVNAIVVRCRKCGRCNRRVRVAMPRLSDIEIHAAG